MTSKLGCHWQRAHPDRHDMPHIEAMQYKSVKLFKNEWDNKDFCLELLSVLPRDSYILARDHALSEQKEDMWRDAQAAGIDHANQWINKVKSGQYYMPLDRTFFLGINEPDATDGDRNKIDIYTASFLRHLAAAGLRGGAFNFSTGHPRTVDGTPNTPADYSVFERSHQAIVEGHHIAVLHIYGTGAVPCVPGHYDRLKACTWQDVEWVCGEFGADEHVIGGGAHIGFHGYFAGRLNDYCAWLDTAIMGVNDPRIHSYQVFTYDHASPWETFDTHPIRDALESYPWRHMQQQPTTPTTPPVTVHLPSVGTGGQPTHPQIPYGSRLATAVTANLRLGPSLQAPIIREVPPGTVFDMVGYSDDWYQVPRGDGEGDGWFHKSVVKQASEQPAPSEPVGDKWQRSREFVARWEGGYQNVHNDKGNWTGCEVGKGENRGTKYGISACSYPDLDIPNLSMEEATAIYERDYWRASGADKLPWPYCLLVFDTAVLHGVSTARQWQAEAGADPYAFAAKRLRTYTKMDNWDFWGKAWANRVADLLEEMSA